MTVMSLNCSQEKIEKVFTELEDNLIAECRKYMQDAKLSVVQV